MIKNVYKIYQYILRTIVYKIVDYIIPFPEGALVSKV